MSSDEKDELFSMILDAILEALEETVNPKKKKMFNFGMDPITMMLAAELLKGGNAPDERTAPKATKAKSEDDILNEFLGKICH